MAERSIKFEVIIKSPDPSQPAILFFTDVVKADEAASSRALRGKGVSSVEFTRIEGITLDPQVVHVLVTVAIAAGTKLAEIAVKQIIQSVFDRIKSKSPEATLASNSGSVSTKPGSPSRRNRKSKPKTARKRPRTR